MQNESSGHDGLNQRQASVYFHPLIEGQIAEAAGSVMISSSLWAIPRLPQPGPDLGQPRGLSSQLDVTKFNKACISLNRNLERPATE